MGTGAARSRGGDRATDRHNATSTTTLALPPNRQRTASPAQAGASSIASCCRFVAATSDSSSTSISDWIVTSAGLGAALVGYAAAGWLGALIGLGLGLTSCAGFMQKNRYHRG